LIPVNNLSFILAWRKHFKKIPEDIFRIS
jgi:hypothetical protein